MSRLSTAACTDRGSRTPGQSAAVRSTAGAVGRTGAGARAGLLEASGGGGGSCHRAAATARRRRASHCLMV